MVSYAFAALDFFPGGGSWAVALELAGFVVLHCIASAVRNKVTPVPAMHRLSAGHHQTRPLRCNPSPRPPPGQDAVDSLADAALAARTRFQPRELAHVLWNMSRLGYVDDPFYLAFVPGALDVAFWGMHRGDVHLSGH